MSSAEVLDLTLNVVIAMLTLGLFLTLVRLVRGPSLPDRVVALELVAMLVVGMVLTYAIIVDQPVFLDVGIVLALITFLAAVAFALYLEKRIQR